MKLGIRFDRDNEREASGSGAANGDQGGASGPSGAQSSSLPTTADPAGSPPASPALQRLPDEWGIDDDEAPIVTADQPEDSQAATAQEGASGEDAGTAGQDEGQPADDSTLSPEAVRAIVRKHADLAREELADDIERERQSAADQTRAEMLADPNNDQDWAAYTQAAAGSFGAIADALEKFEQTGEAPDIRTLSQNIAQTTAYTQAAERRAHYATFHGTLTAFTDQIIADVGKDLDPGLVEAAKTGIKEAEQLYRRYERAREPQSRAQAWAEYVRHALPAAFNIALADGRRLGKAEAEQQFKTDLTYKENIGRANGYAMAQAGMPAPEAPRQSAAPLTSELIDDMDDDEYERRRPEILKWQSQQLQGVS